MNEVKKAAPAGWYPSPDGGQRYWDGESWLALPDPMATSRTPSETQPSASGNDLENQSIRERLKRHRIAVAAIGVLIIAAAIGGGLALKSSQDTKAAEAAAQSAAVAAAEQEAARLDEEKRTQAAADSSARLSRSLSVIQIESGIKTMAEKHVTTGLIDGPITSVDCSPVGGGSTDDLTEKTTIFECFAATKDNGDGTHSGYKYHSTMNWGTGSATYGFGAP